MNMTAELALRVMQIVKRFNRLTWISDNDDINKLLVERDRITLELGCRNFGEVHQRALGYLDHVHEVAKFRGEAHYAPTIEFIGIKWSQS